MGTLLFAYCVRSQIVLFFLWYVITPNNGKKHGSGLLNGLKSHYLDIAVYTCVCMYYILYIKPPAKIAQEKPKINNIYIYIL